MGKDSEERLSCDEESSSKETSPIDRKNENAWPETLENTLRANSYQLKLLLLFLYWGVQNDYTFRLATKMDAAGKIDDAFFQYQEKNGSRTVYRFIQAEHRQDERKKIKASDLMSQTDESFSLRKFFISYCKIKENPEMSESKLRQFVIYTKTDFDVESLKSEKIHLRDITTQDDSLNFVSSYNKPERYKLLVDEQSELHKMLKKSSDAHVLAMALAEHVFKKKKMTLRTDIFKLYSSALLEDRVIDVDKKSLSDDFRSGENLSKRVKNFRNIFCAEFLKYMRLEESPESIKLMWTKIEKEKLLYLAEDFKTQISTTSNNTLPEVEVHDSQKISEFLTDLVFRVNQPNEVELGGMFVHELAADKELHLKNADLPYDSLLNKMMEWFKDNGKEQGTGDIFFTHEDSKAFFESVKTDLNTLLCCGLTSSYLSEIAEYDIEFRDENPALSEFLKDDLIADPPALNLVAVEETLLTVLRVYQTVRKTQKYERNDSMIFLPLHKLLLPWIQRQVICTFEIEDSYNLLVIECGSGNEENLQELYSELKKIMRNNGAKKLILVTHEIKKLHFENCNEKSDEVTFNDLTEDSQNKLLQKPSIIFQGWPISFRKLFENRNCDERESKDSSNFQSLIDSSALVKLIRNDKIAVGCSLQRMDEVTNLYVNRRINPVSINKSIFTFSSSSDVIAISGITRDDLKILVGLENHYHKQLVVLDIGQEKEQFAELCNDNSAENVHWLQHERGKWIWKQSHGDITNLLTHRNASQNQESHYYLDDTTVRYLTEDVLADHNKMSKVVIIFAPAGMGKTTMFAYLMNKIKKKQSNLWVIGVDLNNFTSVLAQEKKAEEQGRPSYHDSDVSRAIDFLVEKLSSLKTDFEKNLLKSIFQDRGRVVILFDGLDEISPDYIKTVTDLLQALNKSNGIEKLFISTRPHLSESLEKTMGVCCHTITPFSMKDQVEFLVRFWKAKLHLHDVEGRIKRYAEALIEKMIESIAHRYNDFSGIPLQTRMIAEVYQDNDDEGAGYFESCEEFFHSRPNIPVFEKITNLVDLYTWFVDKKFDIWITEKLKSDFRDLFMEDVIESYRKTFFETHQELALYTLFDSKDLNTLLPNWQQLQSISKCISRVNGDNEQTSIVIQVIDRKPQFVHRKFAEYFVARFLIDKLNDIDHNPELLEFFVGQILLQPNNWMIRSFLNGIVRKESPPPFRQLENNASIDEFWMAVIDKNRDDQNRTIFHVAAIEGHMEIIKFIVSPFVSHNKSWQDLINDEDCDGMSALTLSIDNQQWEAIEYLMLYSRDNYYQIPTILDLAAGAGNLCMVKWSSQKAVDLGVKDVLGETALITAASNGRLQVVKWLLDEVGVDVNFQAKSGQPVLHIIAMNDQVEIFQWLIEKKKFHLEDRSRTIVSTLETVFFMKRWKIIKWLIKNLSEEYRFHDGATMLQKLTFYWNSEDVRFTANLDDLDVDIVIKNGRAKLENDIKFGNLETIRLLVQNEVHVWFEVKAMPETFNVPIPVTDEMLDVLQWMQHVRLNEAGFREASFHFQ